MSHEIFHQLIGKWEGTCRTWFEPEEIADESKITGDITEILDGRFLRHSYETTIQGNRRSGEEWIAFNSITKAFQSCWIDSFHMNYAIMTSEGKEATDRGFSVFGHYDVAENEPQWGWRTTFELVDDDNLIITAYNVEPDGTEVKALETTYHRIG